MEVIQPTNRSSSLRGAFVVGEEDAARFTRLAKDLLGEGATSWFELEMVNGKTYRTESPEDLNSFPFHEGRRARMFAIGADQARTRITASFNKDSVLGGSVHVYCSGQNCESNLSSLVEFMRGMRPWYSILYTVPLWILFTFAELLFAFALFATKGPTWIYIVGGVVFGILIFALIARSWLFSRFAMMFGSEKIRQDHLRSVRRWVFGTLISGIGLGIFGAWIKKRIGL